MEERIEYKGYIIKIVRDKASEDPRSFDSLGSMLCWHKNLMIGDVHSWGIKAFEEYLKTPKDFEKALSENRPAIVLPIYLYDHGNITISTSPFSCKWDSGQVGYLYIKRKEVEREYGKITSEILEKVKTLLEGEVETYDHYLTGNVYGFEVESLDGEQLDSCYGWYGDSSKSGVITEAKAVVDSIVKRDEEATQNDSEAAMYMAL